jgi:nucleoside 2-deoxyribosyltransferase
MSNNKIKCFIAMAFGHTDCDQIYSNYIRPILKEMHVEPIRVDTRQHRDDLNNYIIRMLKESDIALADLTYARPSVYYEAGFAERQIPVIYTARKDHLSRAQADDRLRVHFDLEMKKIVDWSTPDDKTFGRRLRQRLMYFLRPIREKRDAESELRSDRQKFLSLSVSERCIHIRDRFASRLRSKRFWVKPLEKIYPFHGLGLIGIKQVSNTCHFCCVLVGESISKSRIYDINRFRGADMVVDDNNIKKYCDHYFLCTLRNLPKSRLTSCFPHAKPTSTEGRFSLRREKAFFSKAPQFASIHIFPSIDSNIRLTELIAKDIDSLSNEKTNRYTNLIIEEGHYPRILFSRKKLPKKW